MIIALVFFLTPAIALGVGVQPAEFENRPLAAAPSLTAGWGFFTELPAWAADRLPFRDAAVRSSDLISREVFGEPTELDTRRPAAGPVIAPVAPDPTVLPAAGYPQVIEGDRGWLYFGYDVEGKCAPVRPLDEVISGLRGLRAAVEASGRRFVLVVAPDKSTMVPRPLPDRFAGQRCAQERGAQFWHRVTTEAGAIDLRPDLDALAAAGVPIYRKLDTHWTDAGSLTLVRSLADTIQPGASRSWRIAPGRMRQAAADLPPLIGRTGTDSGRSYLLAPDGQQDRTRPYAEDMRTPVHFRSAPAAGMVTAPVAMLTDSFSLPASRYLAATFSDLTTVFYASDLKTVTDVMAAGNVVVLEVVERNLASGTPPVLDDVAIERIAAVLKARPVR
ncbi:MAG TPA: hypothetical protein VFQ77_17840 [Pseudonocardiaceae bacterium]|nr:hypothetical protein [Pseudonocardiaceae bacterium]